MPRDPRACVIVPYFGRLPSWFPFWLRSCEANTLLRWIILTDDPRTWPMLPPNVIVEPYTLEEIRRTLQSILGDDISLPNAYKLCDYRPLYGIVFQDLIGDSPFWGFGDVDVFFGDLTSALPDVGNSTYVRILQRGHLSLVANTEMGRNLWKLEHPEVDFKRIARDPRPLAFDEWGGLSKIVAHHGLEYWHSEIVADLNPMSGRLECISARNWAVQAFYWHRGRAFQAYVSESGEVDTKEWGYIHFQKRRLPEPQFNAADCEGWYVTSRGLVPLSCEPLSPEVLRRMNPRIPFYSVSRRVDRYVKKLRSVLR